MDESGHMPAVTITVDQVIDYLADFLQPFSPDSEIVQAQSNRTAMPADPCIVLTPLLQVQLATPTSAYTDAGTPGLTGDRTIAQSVRIDVQMDFYGAAAGDVCRAVGAAFRTDYATSQFPAAVQPLYCGDGLQSPLVTGEQQYESRWTLTASLQYNAAVAVPQEFFDTASTLTPIAADVEFPLE